jgi:hypothetical protein
MSDRESWLTWQKQVIAEEYKDIKPIRDKAQTSFDKAAKKSLARVKRYGN